MFVCCILWPICLGWLLVLGFYKEDYLLFLNCKVITLTINCDYSLIPVSEWLSRPMKCSYEITYHVTALWHTMWLLLFSIVFKTLRIIWCHKRHCDVMVLPPIRTALAVFEAFSGIYFSNIYWIGLSWFSAVVLRFVLIKQTKLLNVEFKYLVTFSIWVKSTLLNGNENNSSPN